MEGFLHYDDYDDPIPYPSVAGGRYWFLVGEDHNCVIQFLYSNLDSFSGADFYRFWHAECSYVDVATTQRGVAFSMGENKFLWLNGGFLPIEDAFKQTDISLSYANWGRREISMAWFDWLPKESAVFENTAFEMDLKSDQVEVFKNKYSGFSMEGGKTIDTVHAELNDLAGLSKFRLCRSLYLGDLNGWKFRRKS